MDANGMQSLCRRYSEAGSLERGRIGKKIAEYAAAKARRLDKAARARGGLYQANFISVKAGDYMFDSWYGGEVHIFLPSDPDLDVSVPFKAFDPGYEREYAESVEGAGREDDSL